jgi:hypothetical protein
MSDGIDLNVNFDKLMSPELSALFLFLTILIMTLIVYYQLYILEFIITRAHNLYSHGKKCTYHTPQNEETV